MRVYVDGVVDKLIAEGAAVNVSVHLGLNLGSALKLSLLDYEPGSSSDDEWDRPIRVLKENRTFDAKLALRGDATMDRPDLIMNPLFSCEGIGCTKPPITWYRKRQLAVCGRTCFLYRAAHDNNVTACSHCAAPFSAKNRPTHGDADKGVFYCKRSCQLSPAAIVAGVTACSHCAAPFTSTKYPTRGDADKDVFFCGRKCELGAAAEAAGITACFSCAAPFTFLSTIASSSSLTDGTPVVANDGDDWVRGIIVQSFPNGTYEVMAEGGDEGEGSAAGDDDSSNGSVFTANPLETAPLVECEDDRAEPLSEGDPILVRWPHPARDGTSLLRTRVYMPPLSLSLTTFPLWLFARCLSLMLLPPSRSPRQHHLLRVPGAAMEDVNGWFYTILHPI
jgi:hypothetical protein